MLRRTCFVVALISVYSTIAAPTMAAAAWKPTLIPLSSNTKSVATNHYRFLCGPSWTPETKEERVWRSSFCGQSKTNAAASRLGWCHRWAIQNPKLISVTCDRDIRKLSV